MSEEEKEAIALLVVFNLANNLQHISEKDFADIKKANRIILNLIEKQQKELERFNNEMDLDYVDKNFIPKDKIRTLIKESNYPDTYNFKTISVSKLKELLEE